MLPSETVLSIFEDPNWRMWIGTQNGLVRLEATSVQVVPLPNGTEADYGTISEASDSKSWMVVGRLFRVNTHKAEPSEQDCGCGEEDPFKSGGATEWHHQRRPLRRSRPEAGRISDGAPKEGLTQRGSPTNRGR